ncbi:hypothetical protein ZEAMMB73_Zm00001d021824, partial [Zea mays]
PLPRIHAEEQPGLRGRAPGQGHWPEPGVPQLVAPPLHAHLPCPLGPPYGHDVAYLRAQELSLNRVPLGGLLLGRAGAVSQRVEQRRVVVQRLHEPAQEIAAVAQVLFHDGDQLRAQAPEQPHRAHVRPRHVIEAVVHPVHHGGLVIPPPLARAEERRGVGDVPDLPLDGSELEREAERGREVGEAAASGLEDVERRAEPGDPERPRLARAGREDVEEPRPLQALHDVQVDHVEAVLAVERLQDGLVGREVRELDERRQRVVRLERHRHAAALRGRQRAERERRVGAQVRAEHARAQRVTEVGRHALRGRPERRRQLRDLGEQLPRLRQLVHGHRLRAPQQQAEQPQASRLRPFLRRRRRRQSGGGAKPEQLLSLPPRRTAVPFLLFAGGRARPLGLHCCRSVGGGRAGQHPLEHRVVGQ